MIDVKKLPDNVQGLKQIIIGLQKENENYEKKIDVLPEEIELYYTRKSCFINKIIV